MRIDFSFKSKSGGINRVYTELYRSKPSNVESTNDKDADLVIIHVNGQNEHNTRYALELKDKGIPYIVIQYVLQSSRNPDPKDWYTLWNNAKFVWSYYDLKEHIDNFYHAPLASDPNTFYPVKCEKLYTVGTLGNCYKAECVGEAQMAAWLVGGNAVHVGDPFNSDPIVEYKKNISDDELRLLYNSCKYFSTLRRKDGFEVPALETMLCGIKPIMFDTPNYRQWFDGLATFIPEAPIKPTIMNLKKLFEQDEQYLSQSQIDLVKERFNWDYIMKGFWDRCMN